MRPKVLLEALVANKVDFVLIGGLAAMLHGTTRVTRDIDIAYATHRKNLARLCQVMNAFEPRAIVLGEPSGETLTLTPDILKASSIMQITTTVGEIDMLNKIEGFPTYGLVKKYSEIQDLGAPVPVLSVEGLIRAKQALKRPKDVQDIIELEAIREVKEITTAPESSSQM